MFLMNDCSFDTIIQIREYDFMPFGSLFNIIKLCCVTLGIESVKIPDDLAKAFLVADQMQK